MAIVNKKLNYVLKIWLNYNMMEVLRCLEKERNTPVY